LALENPNQASTARGINFNEESPPDYLDFAKVSFTIGLTINVVASLLH